MESIKVESDSRDKAKNAEKIINLVISSGIEKVTLIEEPDERSHYKPSIITGLKICLTNGTEITIEQDGAPIDDEDWNPSLPLIITLQDQERSL
jgi:hypothetical protein